MHSISLEQHYSIAKASGGEWHSQHDVDPADESESGIDNDADTNNLSVDDFLKACSPADGEQHDQMSRDHHLCAQHMARTDVHLAVGNRKAARQSNKRAMAHFQRFHSALKKAVQN